MELAPRPDWDETWLSVARTIARRSLCSRDKVGAVVVSKSNRLLETGYNGPPAGFSTDGQPCSEWCTRARSGGFRSERGKAAYTQLVPDYSDCPALHAEANALMRGDRTAREGGTIYVTSHVCMGCAKLIANSGLNDVVIAAQHDGAHREPEKVYRFLDQCGISVMIA